MKKNKVKKNPAGGSRKIIAILVVLAIPVVLFLGVEGLLRVFGAGYPTQPFSEARAGIFLDDSKGYKKYYPKSTDTPDVDAIKQNIFQMPKPQGVLRGVVLGESTAQGFPYLKNQSFGKLLEWALNSGAQGDLEVLNLGRAAMTSYYLRDMSAKVREYDPDFLVIYAGHNEYYGTISRSTGSFHAGRQLYLALKEWKIFQGLFDLFAPASPKVSGTRMAQQFADKAFPWDPAVDKEVTADFLDNLNASVEPYLKQGKPVVIYEPVSNLGMPPFAGAKPGMEEDLKNWNGVLNSGDVQAAQTWALKYQGPEYQKLATVVYLQAKTEAQKTGAWPLERLTLAKDLDANPFRARSHLVETLRTWAEKKTKEFPSLIYIKTGEELKARMGQEAFTGALFIDHLHFNFLGQRALASLAAPRLITALGLKPAAESVEKLLADDKACRAGVHLTDLFEYRAVSSIEKLLKSPPFSTMVLTPDFGLEKMKGSNTIYQNPDLTQILAKGSPDDFFSRGMSYFRQVGVQVFEVQNIFAMAWANPGSPESHRMVAEYFNSLGAKDKAQGAMKKAELLSGGRK